LVAIFFFSPKRLVYDFFLSIEKTTLTGYRGLSTLL